MLEKSESFNWARWNPGCDHVLVTSLRNRMTPCLLLLILARLAAACTSILVDRAASRDGSTYIARSDDTADATSTTNKLYYHPPRDGPAPYRTGSLSVELPGPGLAYTALPVSLPPPPDAGVYAAGSATARQQKQHQRQLQLLPPPPCNATGETSGVNSAGVAVSATETLFNSAAALAADPYTPGGVGEDSIPSLLLPQAATARGAAVLLGSLVETLGAREGFGVLLADPREAWYLESASGHHWLAARLPEGSILVAANQGRFQEVDLDSEGVLHSPRLREFAISAGLFVPTSPDEPLNFFKAFMKESPLDRTLNHPRVCALFRRLGGAGAPPCAGLPLLPAFLHPAVPLSVHDVMAGLRNHFDGSQHDPYLHANPSEPHRPIAVLRASAGHVTRLRQGLPDGLSIIHYVAMGAPLLAPFIPIYKGLPGDALPRELTAACSEPDPVSLFWRARRLQALVFQDLPALLPNAAAAMLKFEADFEERQRPALEARYRHALARGDGPGAAAELVSFTAAVVEQAGGLLQELAEAAAAALGLPGIPPDSEVVAMLDDAAQAYSWRHPLLEQRGGLYGGRRIMLRATS